jgi:hypothetical protein
VSGTFFAEQSVEAISSAVKRLADLDLDPADIAAHADQFGRAQFFRKMQGHIDGLLAARTAPR